MATTPVSWGGHKSKSLLAKENNDNKTSKRDRKSNLNFQTGTIWNADNLDVMRGMNSGTVDLIYLDPPFKKQKPFKAKMTAKTEDRLLEYLRICEGYTDQMGKYHEPRDAEFAKDALEYIGSLRNKDNKIVMQFNDAWNLDGIKASQLEKLKADRLDIHNFINAVPEDDMKAYLIFMAVRILEMHRILKPSGSIYLHCDYEVNSYIRLIMDLVFGRDNMKNEIIWHYTGGGRSKTYFSRKSDTIFWYSKTKLWTFNIDSVRVPYKQTSGYAKSGIKAKSGKIYRPNPLGTPMDNVWDMPIINPLDHKERIGYPTQKPLALLERIIEASSNEDDLIFDPFAGCATAIDAAYNLNRRWIACDSSYMSVILLRLRLEGPSLLDKRYPYKYTETDAPVRNDIKEQIDYSYEGIAKRVDVRKLYGAEIYTRQDGRCAICKRRINFKAGDIDHVKPIANGGTNDIDNLQFISTEEHRKKTAQENSNRQILAK